ncbi:MAG TPA: hypothetical protein DHV36_21495 [Desulfobacteraceae bacterium]|nr:hypothetical protein [Desulfobacteraceae bacterium]
MTAREFPHILTLDPVPHIRIQIIRIPDLAGYLLTEALPANYTVCKPLVFAPENFCRPFLSPEELERLNRFKALKKQVEWLCGRFALKWLVRSVLTPESRLAGIRISYREEGAPFLDALPDHCISLSHSSDYTAAAVALKKDFCMGIDIEAIGKQPDSAFLKTAFTEREILDMASGRQDGPRAVFRHWTLKEAYLKYIGRGFNENLHQVEILTKGIFHGGTKADLACWSQEAVPGYMLSAVFDPLASDL